MVDKRFFLPLTALLGGAAAFVLRLLQDKTGFEAETGLPVRGNLAGLALIVLLVGLTAVFWFLGRKLPPEDPEAPPEFPTDFSSGNTALLSVTMGGVALMALSGLADLAEGLGVLPEGLAVYSRHSLYSILREGGLGFSPHGQILAGILILASSSALFLAAAVCRKREEQRPFPVAALLPPGAALVVRLVFSYRVASVNPSLEMYYPELLALVFMTLAYYRLSSFAFQSGDTRRFSLYACLAFVFSCTALADGSVYLSALLILAGGALSLLGFLLLRLSNLPSPEPEDDGTII